MNAKLFSNILLWITLFGMLLTACIPSNESPPPTATKTVVPPTPLAVTAEPIQLLELPTLTLPPFDRPTATKRTTDSPLTIVSNTPIRGVTPTFALSATLVATDTPEASPTEAATATLIATYTSLPLPTAVLSATLVATNRAVSSPTEAATATLIAPEASPTEAATATLIATYTSLPLPTAVLSATLVPTYRALPSPTEVLSATLVPTYTPLPPPTERIPTQPTIVPTEATGVIILSEESGVEGRVELGPSCGNMPTQGDADCSNMPYQAYLTITNSNGEVVAEGSSNADGSYRFTLPPGDYVLVPEEPQGPISADRIPFSVTANKFTYVTVLYDTMIP